MSKFGKFEVYHHHGVPVWVQSDLKGKHRKHCLCWSCGRFNLDDREGNCRIANLIFRLDKALEVTTPVWECMEFYPADQPELAEHIQY